MRSCGSCGKPDGLPLLGNMAPLHAANRFWHPRNRVSPSWTSQPQAACQRQPPGNGVGPTWTSQPQAACPHRASSGAWKSWIVELVLPRLAFIPRKTTPFPSLAISLVSRIASDSGIVGMCDSSLAAPNCHDSDPAIQTAISGRSPNDCLRLRCEPARCPPIAVFEHGFPEFLIVVLTQDSLW